MGCTSSREVGNNASSSPPRSRNLAPSAGNGDPSSSSQAIVQRTSDISADVRAPPTHGRSSRSNASTTAAADGRPNSPLCAPLPVLSSPPELTVRPWTVSELYRQREAFFDTRVTGSAEVWAAVKIVCDMLRNGDVVGAQGFLDASGLTCPTGRVASERHSTRAGSRGKKGGVYDGKGQLYDVPGWVISDPKDLIQEVEEQDADNEKYGAIATDGAAGHMTEKSGKEQEADIGDLVKVKARLSGKETDVIVSVGTEQRIGVLVDKIKEKTGVKKMRLAHMGKMLGENEKLSQTGWAPGHVFNAFVFE